MDIDDKFANHKEVTIKNYNLFDDEIKEIKRKMSLKDIADAELSTNMNNCVATMNHGKAEVKNLGS